jgi:tellurite resistance protein TerC
MDFLVSEWMGKPFWMWKGFLLIVLLLLAFDLGVLNRKDKEMGVAQSLWLSAFYVAFSMLYGAGIWWAYEVGELTTSDGTHAGIAYFTGFFIEKALSIDNVFVISLIFGYFAIPRRYQYRALVWGIIGVIVLRGIMIAAGAALVQEYSWVLYIFGAFLIATGIKMLVVPEGEQDISKNPIVRFMRKHMRVTDELHGQKFFVRQMDPAKGKKMAFATPLFLALVVINIAAMVHRFHYLKYALALVLVFIGGKIFWNQMVGKLDPAISLGVTAAIIASGIFVSLWKTRNQQPESG